MTLPLNQSSDDQWLADISGGLGVYSGAKRGGEPGAVQASAGAARLAGAGTIASDILNVGNIYGGLKKGGAEGDIFAAANAAQLGGRLGAFGGASGAFEKIGGGVGAGISVYEFAKNWQSGQTGSDALRGAEAGASVGSLFGPEGTLIGAGIGGAVGAVSSLFGPGKTDPEHTSWNNVSGQYASMTQQEQLQAQQAMYKNPAQAFQLLSGAMEAGTNEPGHSEPLQQVFGTNGASTMLYQMFPEINLAMQGGKIPRNATPQQIYSQIVVPWLKMRGAPIDPNAVNSQGQNEGKLLQGVVTSLIGAWQSGSLKTGTPVGIDGQPMSAIAPYGAPVPLYSAEVAAGALSIFNTQKAALTEATDKLNSSVATFGTTQSSGSSISTALLAIPGVLAAGALMADPNNPMMTTQPVTPGAGAGTADPSWLSSLSSDIGSFLSSPAGSLAEFGTLAAVGMSEASSQKKTNDQLASSLSTAGQPFVAQGAKQVGQLTGGPSVGGPLGASIDQQTGAAKNLGQIATTYSKDALTPAQSSQVEDFIKQQRAMVDTQLAQSGNTDSSARQAAYQQIDDNAANLTQELITGNTQLAEGALNAVQGTYSNLLNQALASSEFGFSTELAAVQTQIQSDTQLAQSLNQLFAGIAMGLGNAFSGGRTPGSGGSPVGAVPPGVAGSPAGGGIASGNAGSNIDTTVNDPSTGQPFGAVDPSTGLPFGSPPVDVSGDLSNVPPPDFNLTDPFSGGG